MTLIFSRQIEFHCFIIWKDLPFLNSHWIVHINLVFSFQGSPQSDLLILVRVYFKRCVNLHRSVRASSVVYLDLEWEQEISSIIKCVHSCDQDSFLDDSFKDRYIYFRCWVERIEYVKTWLCLVTISWIHINVSWNVLCNSIWRNLTDHLSWFYLNLYFTFIALSCQSDCFIEFIRVHYMVIS